MPFFDQRERELVHDMVEKLTTAYESGKNTPRTLKYNKI